MESIKENSNLHTVDGFTVLLGRQRCFVTRFFTIITNTTSGWYIFNAILPLVQLHRQRIKLTYGLQRIFTSYNAGIYHNNRRDGNYVTRMARKNLQTKGLLTFVAKTTSSQTFRLGSVETNFDTNNTKHNQLILKVSAG